MTRWRRLRLRKKMEEELEKNCASIWNNTRPISSRKASILRKRDDGLGLLSAAQNE